MLSMFVLSANAGRVSLVILAYLSFLDPAVRHFTVFTKAGFGESLYTSDVPFNN